MRVSKILHFLKFLGLNMICQSMWMGLVNAGNLDDTVEITGLICIILGIALYSIDDPRDIED